MITGGVALGFWREPRTTKDIDLSASVPLASVDRILATRDGIPGGPEELPDVIRFRFGDWDVDLFVAKSDHDRAALARAKPVELEGHRFRVATAEDLVVHKFVKLRTDR